MIFGEEVKNFKRSWVHHTGMQLTTLLVLAATFSVVVFFIGVSYNLQRILSGWGDKVELTLYLQDDASEDEITAIRDTLEQKPEFTELVSQVRYVDREQATGLFKAQMLNYAPDLLADTEFKNPFPATFQVELKPELRAHLDTGRLDTIAESLRKLPGVDDVSYGQEWVKNYSAVVAGFNQGGWTIILVLIMGSLLVVGNSVRASISSRRDEIEIMELTGATASMIRRPYIFEGAVMGGLAGVIGLGFNYVVFVWAMSFLRGNLALARLVPQLGFVSPVVLVAIIMASIFFGGVGAFIAVRRLNDGWAASRGNEA